MTIGSLSSGYGGLEMALARLSPIDVRWHAEIDPDASKVLEAHWPDVPNLGDFTAPGFDGEPVDIECGGIPCQPFSAAGRQKGADDHRHLWPFWRAGIARRRPVAVVFENVANLTRGKMRPIFDGIVADLLELGYDVRWCLLGACAVGAAHHRHRVFLLACRSRATPNARQVHVQTCGQKLAAYLPTPSAVSYGSNQGGVAGRTARLELLPTVGASDGSVGGIRASKSAIRSGAGPRMDQALELARGQLPAEFASWGEVPAHWARGMPLLPSPIAGDATRGPVDQDRAGKRGRASSSQLGAEVINLLRSPNARDGDGARGQGSIEHMRRRMESGHTINLGDQVQLLPSPRHSDASNGGPNQGIATGDIALSSAVQPERWGKYAEAIARHEAVIGRPAPEPTEIGPKGGRRLAAVFSEWLMMLPEGHLTDVLERNAALARAGNGVVPLQAATAIDILVAHHYD